MNNTDYNLDKDKRVLGKNWLSTYRGWFSDEENFKTFIDAVTPLLPKKPLDILYVASASGLLGERLLSALGSGSLTIVDVSQEHLDQNANSATKKIKADLMELNLDKQFDVILMRSSLDYFPSRDQQIKVLQIIRKHLKNDGLFINQPAYIPNIVDRNAVSQAYNYTEKIGDRLFQSTDLGSIYEEAGFETPIQIGKGKVMEITEADHTKRYDLNDYDIAAIQEILEHARHYASVTSHGYKMKFEFPIFISRKQ